MKINRLFFPVIAVLLFAISCSTRNAAGILIKKSERERYEDGITKGGGINNPIVKSWLAAGEYALNYPLGILNNYTEAGMFTTNNFGAHSFITNLKRGMKISVSLLRKDTINTKVYIDMWLAPDSTSNQPRRFIGAGDTATNTMQYIAYNDEKLIIRFQKEIGNAGSYQFSLQTGPSFTFPIRTDVKSNIGSLWGEPRDGGVRRHEGIDIFAAKGSPVVAVADGIISEVSENAIGGKVVFLRPRGSKIRAYYEHLDVQSVPEDKQVFAGEVIGLVGNTGNAVNTVPHLHFGIYDNAGVAMDPLLFVKPVKNTAKKVQALPAKAEMITVKNAMVYNNLLLNTYYLILPKNTVVQTEAATENYYKVILADGRKGFIAKGDLK